MEYVTDPSCRLGDEAIPPKRSARYRIIRRAGGNRKRCRLFSRCSIFRCLSRTDIQSSSLQGECNSVVPEEHWQAITQAENWMAALIQQYPHFTQLIFIMPAKPGVCHFLWEMITAAAGFFSDSVSQTRRPRK